MTVLRAGFHGTVGQSSAQFIDGSLRFDSSKSQYLQRTFGSGNRQKYTWSGWVKKTKFGDWYGALLKRTDELRISNSEKLSFNNYGVTNLESTGVLRDPNSFYHIVFKVDTTQAFSGGKIRGYINGVEFVSSDASHSTNDNTDLNDAAVHYIGNGTSSRYADYYLSQCYFIDGQALGPKFFGFNDPLTGTWRPRKLRAGDTSLISDGTTWSSFSSATLVSGSALANAFNGNVSIDSNSTATSVSGDNTWTFSPTASLPVDNSLVVYVYPRSGTLTFKVNGVTITTNTGNSFNRVDLSEAFKTAGNLDSLVIESSGSGSYWMIAAIEIDGEILTDSAVTVDFGTNGFYLPLDGNSPIGQDKSGKGNDWAPVNFGTSNSLDKATGALPILNTVSGGNYATAGVRTDSNSSSLVFALPLVGIVTDVSNQINSGSTTKVVTVTGPTASTDDSNFYGGSFDFDGTNDYLSASSSDLGFDTNTAFTIEGWFYADALPSNGSGSGGAIFGNRENTQADSFTCYIGSSATNTIGIHVGGGTVTYFSAPGGLSTNRWFHLAMVRNTSNVVEFFLDGVSLGTGTPASDLGNGAMYIGCWGSGRGAFFNGHIQDFRVYKGVAKYTSNFIPARTDSTILPDTPSGVSGGYKLTKITDGAVSFDGNGDYLTIASNSDFNLDNTWTIEYFFYNQSTAVQRQYYFHNNTNNLQTATNGTQLLFYNGSGTTTFGSLSLNRWHHVAVVNSSGSVTFYIDGQQAATGTAGAVSANTALTIGAFSDGQNAYKGFISNFRVVNGTAVYSSNFTPPTEPLTNITNTKLLCCQSNTSTTAAAVSPQSLVSSGDPTATNFNPFNTNINTVRGQESVYPTLNPLFRSGTYSNGNLTQSTTSGNGHYRANVGINSSSGKFYFEYEPTGGAVSGMVGLCTNGHADNANLNGDSAFSYYGVTGYKQGSPSAVDSAYGETYTFGDVIGVAFDTYNGGSLEFFKNGVSQGVAFSNEFPFFPYYPAFSAGSSSNTTTYNANFGQKPFKFPPPDGYQPLSLSISDVPSGTMIADPAQYVGVVTYTGSGAARHIKFGMQPDLVWTKQRAGGSLSGARTHELIDSVRGTEKALVSSSTAIEYTSTGSVTSFIADGYTIGTEDRVNENNADYVAWAWKAGGGKPGGGGFFKDGIEYANAAALGLDSGGLTVTAASIGSKQGFSIIEYTGSGGNSDVNHGLDKPPKFIIIKNTEDTTDWIVGHSSIARNQNTNDQYYLNLNGTSAETSTSNRFKKVPDSSLIHLGRNSSVNALNDSHIAYCWHDVPGLQKFGDYQNPSGNGAFVELGFKPAVLIIKCVRNISSSSGAGDWVIKDTKRSFINNPSDGNTLVLNVNNAEDNYYGAAQASVDILSNGFKIRHPGSSPGGDPGRLYIYAAWAEAPAVNLYGGQSNAR